MSPPTDDPWLDFTTNTAQSLLRGLASLAGFGIFPIIIVVGFILAGLAVVGRFIDTKDDGCLGFLGVPIGGVSAFALIGGLEAASKSRRVARLIAQPIVGSVRLVGVLLLLPWRILRHPVRTTRAVGSLLASVPTATRSPLGASLVTGAVVGLGVWAWVVAEGLTTAHGVRVLATAGVLMVGLTISLMRSRLAIRVRIAVAGVALAGAASCWLFVPVDGRSLFAAWRESATLADALTAAPAERFDTFRADAERRRWLAATFRPLAGQLAAAEAAWGERAATAGLADAQRLMTRDGALARVRVGQLAGDLTAAQAAGVPGSLVEVRRSVLRVRLDLAAWSARADLRGHRFEEAAGRVARNAEELSADATELGLADEADRLRDSFAFAAALARAAGKPDPP